MSESETAVEQYRYDVQIRCTRLWWQEREPKELEAQMARFLHRHGFKVGEVKITLVGKELVGFAGDEEGWVG